MNGTDATNTKDIGTDLYLGLGKLKDTDRYKEADQNLQKAKTKYGTNNATITGHSLGSTISQYIAKPEDKVYSLDGGYTFGQPTKGGNQHNYRTSGDAISLLSSGAKNMTTLPNRRGIYETAKNIATGGLLGLAKSVYDAHDIDNIKDQNITL